MKEYCVDLEIAKELKENGFPQINGQYYINLRTDEFKDLVIEPARWIEEFCSIDTQEELDYQKLLLMPTDYEILKQLPKKLFGCHLEIDRTDIAHYIWYVPIGTDIDQRPKDFVSGSMDEKLVNALGQKWLYLKKERLLNEVQR